GNPQTTAPFVAYIDENDREKDWIAYAKNLRACNFQYKSPLVTDVIEGVIQQVTIDFAEGGVIQATINIVGVHIS
ncbi:MAG: hypothetical protein WAZ18_05485, partial [Alphaproteobacteria bacterium]